MKEKRKEEQGSAECQALDISAFRTIGCAFHPDTMRDIEAAAAIAGQSLREFATRAIIRHTYGTIGLDRCERAAAKLRIIPLYLPQYGAGAPRGERP